MVVNKNTVYDVTREEIQSFVTQRDSLGREKSAYQAKLSELLSNSPAFQADKADYFNLYTGGFHTDEAAKNRKAQFGAAKTQLDGLWDTYAKSGKEGDLQIYNAAQSAAIKAAGEDKDLEKALRLAENVRKKSTEIEKFSREVGEPLVDRVLNDRQYEIEHTRAQQTQNLKDLTEGLPGLEGYAMNKAEAQNHAKGNKEYFDKMKDQAVVSRADIEATQRQLQDPKQLEIEAAQGQLKKAEDVGDKAEVKAAKARLDAAEEAVKEEVKLTPAGAGKAAELKTKAEQKLEEQKKHIEKTTEETAEAHVKEGLNATQINNATIEPEKKLEIIATAQGEKNPEQVAEKKVAELIEKPVAEAVRAELADDIKKREEIVKRYAYDPKRAYGELQGSGLSQEHLEAKYEECGLKDAATKAVADSDKGFSGLRKKQNAVTADLRSVDGGTITQNQLFRDACGNLYQQQVQCVVPKDNNIDSNELRKLTPEQLARLGNLDGKAGVSREDIELLYMDGSVNGKAGVDAFIKNLQHAGIQVQEDNKQTGPKSVPNAAPVTKTPGQGI